MDQSRKNTVVTILPPWQLLRGDNIGVLAGIEPLDKRRVLGCHTTDIRPPSEKCAVLVVVERDGAGGLLGDAVLGYLEGDLG